MINKTIIAVLSVVGLGACQHMDHCDWKPYPNPLAPRVNVVGGQIVVDQEPMVFTRDKVNVHIVWQLPSDGDYSFPEDGIVFDKSAVGEIVECRRAENGLKFQCLNKHAKPGRYKYTINVNKGKTRLTQDPHVVNL